MSTLIPLLSIILIGGYAAAGIARRLGLPGVFGELVIGLALGPLLLRWIHDPNALALFGQLGVLLLMLLAGLETDLGTIRGVGWAAGLSAFIGALLPFAMGAALATMAGQPVSVALFVGAALSATSVSITAATLRELGKLQTRAGRTILLAAVVDDVLVLLLITFLGETGTSSPILPLLRLTGFLVMIGVGGWCLPHLLRRVAGHLDNQLALVVGVSLLAAWLAEYGGGLAPITGAYVAGMLLARALPQHSTVTRGVETLATGFFASIFFVSIGLTVRLTAVPPVLFGMFLLLAIATKLVGCSLGALMGGLTRPEAVTVGMGMVPRGEIALIVAAIGYQRGLFSTGWYSLLVLVAIGTTVLTPLGLKVVYSFTSRGAALSPASLHLVQAAGRTES